MKKLAATIFIVLGVSLTAQAALIEVAPSSSTVILGESFDLELQISGLGDGAAPSLGAYDLDILYDGSVLQLDALAIGDPVLGDQLDAFGLGSIVTVSFGFDIVNLLELSLDSASDLDDFQAPAFTLATLTFQAIGVGVSSLVLNVNALGDAFGLPLAFDTIGASVTVPGDQQVPEPSGLALVMIGAAAAWGRSRRKAQPD